MASGSIARYEISHLRLGRCRIGPSAGVMVGALTLRVTKFMVIDGLRIHRRSYRFLSIMLRCTQVTNWPIPISLPSTCS